LMRQLLTMSLPDVADVMLTETMSVHSPPTASAFSGFQAIASRARRRSAPRRGSDCATRSVCRSAD
jgi:hypothetical protein